jgi:DNA-binding transcriptional ArsR family regulator
MPDSDRSRIARLASVAGVLADASRLRLLLALIEREATVSELVALLGIPQPRVSTHLGVLLRAGLVSFRPSGRSRFYAVDAARVEPLLTGLQFAAVPDAAEPDHRARRELALDTPLRRARRCYDHIAGLAGVALLDALLARDWLAAEAGPRERIRYVLRPEGETGLEARGVDLVGAARARRLYAFRCPDWTEGRPHLGGALGCAIADALERDGFITRAAGRREVRLRRPLTAWLSGADGVASPP